MKFIPLGVVGRPFGVRGEIRIKPHNPRTSWFDNAAGVWIGPESSQAPEHHRIVKRRRHKEYIILALEGICDRDRAEELRGMQAAAPEDRLEPLDPDEYYWHQLIGLRVLTTEGELLGEVVRMEETRPEIDGNDVFVISTGQGELMLPATAEVVSEVDLAKGRILVNVVPGLTGGQDRK